MIGQERISFSWTEKFVLDYVLITFQDTSSNEFSLDAWKLIVYNKDLAEELNVLLDSTFGKTKWGVRVSDWYASPWPIVLYKPQMDLIKSTLEKYKNSSRSSDNFDDPYRNFRGWHSTSDEDRPKNGKEIIVGHHYDWKHFITGVYEEKEDSVIFEEFLGTEKSTIKLKDFDWWKYIEMI